MSNHSRNHSGSGRSRAERRANMKLINQERIPTGIDSSSGQLSAPFPHDPNELPADKSVLFAVSVVDKTIAAWNHNNIKKAFKKEELTKQEPPSFIIDYAHDAESDAGTIDTELKEAELLGNLDRASAAFGHKPPKWHIEKTISTSRSTDLDVAKFGKLVSRADTTMAMALYPPSIPVHHAERSKLVEQAIAASPIPVLRLVMPEMQPEIEAGPQLESGTVSGQLDAPTNPDTYR